MRNLRILFGIIALMLLALPAVAQDGQVAVTLERGACFGSCPIYTVTIYTDGTVVYNGERFVDVTGEQTGSIDPAEVEQLIAGFEASGYFDWNDSYTDADVTDAPYITTSVTRDGETKQIVRYTGDGSAPLALPYLETWIDAVAHTAQWTGQEISLTRVPSFQHPVITLERTPCFGMCPTYGLNLFADGTVVYIGFANVAVTGVQVGTVDASGLDLLLSEATAIGYFGWQDEYTHQLITDQPTVITSLSTDEQYKRIVRYDGDPNAPIGLVRFEDRIDQLANVEQWVNPQ
jgi:hypothetical protein